jgi:hypothetical protein
MSASMDQSDPPLESGNAKKKTLGNRTDRRNRTGRPLGVRPQRIREREALMKELGGDPPHIALLKKMPSPEDLPEGLRACQIRTP